jgi:hypothetical protein
MAQVVVTFDLSPTAYEMLSEITDAERESKKDPSSTPEKWVYFVFRRIAGDWTRSLDRLDVQGFIELSKSDGTTGKLELSDVKFDDFKPAEGGNFQFKMPQRMLETLLRGVAMQDAWNKKCQTPEVKWTDFASWLREVSSESIINAHPDVVEQAIKKEGAEWYEEVPPPKNPPRGPPPGVHVGGPR